ncbi:MAG TPA: helix-turn-helix transcriptional regulator [Candidatus Saccharimonadales bacterium]
MNDSSDIARSLQACFPVLSEAWCAKLATALVKEVEAGIKLAERNNVDLETIHVTMKARPAPPELAKALRKLRTDKNLTQEQVANALEWSHAKIVRIETGEVPVRLTALLALLQFYDLALESPEAQALLDMRPKKRTQR